MTKVTDLHVREALEANAVCAENGRWKFHDSPVFHDEQDALGITRACLIFGVPVTDTLTGAAWCALAVRIEDIEQRLDARYRRAARA